MKSILILFIAILSVPLMVQGGNPMKKTIISGQINGLSNDTIITITYPLGNQPDHIKPDTIIAKNGKFTYEPDLVNPQIIQFVPLQTIPTTRDSKLISGLLILPSYTIELFVSPGENIGILAKLNPITIDYQVSGSSFNARYAKLKDEWKPLQIDYVENSLKELFLTSLTDEQRASIKQENKKIQRALDSIPKDYVVKHPNDSLSAFLALTNPWMYSETFMEKFRKLDTTAMTPYIREAFSARIKHEEYLIEYVNSRKRIIVGAEAPDFTLKNDKGKSFTLSSLRGKYVVLDFWGSWCTWCIKGFPDLIKAYEKSKNYVAFVGIACKDEKRPEAWKNILAKYPLKWTQLINDDSDLKNDVISRYGLLVYPTKIIIDPQGKIIYHQDGESQDLYHRLDALLDELKKAKQN